MQIPVTWKRRLIEAWPKIYDVINGVTSYLVRNVKKIGVDVISEIIGKH